jgi:hypothetical protein
MAVAGRDEDSRSSVLDDLGRPTGVAGDHGLLHRHRFDDDAAKGLR